MKNPMDMTLAEIEVMLMIDGNCDLFPASLLDYLQAREKRIRNYQVQAITKQIREKEPPVQKRVTSVDAGLLNACVLVSE